MGAREEFCDRKIEGAVRALGCFEWSYATYGRQGWRVAPHRAVAGDTVGPLERDSDTQTHRGLG